MLGHPLALFPTLENGLSPELYEEIVDILEPDLLDMSDSETDEHPSPEEPILPQINIKGGVLFYRFHKNPRKRCTKIAYRGVYNSGNMYGYETESYVDITQITRKNLVRERVL